MLTEPENVRYTIVPSPTMDIPVVEWCDIPKKAKDRTKDDRCVNKQIAKRRKKNKNRKTHRK